MKHCGSTLNFVNPLTFLLTSQLNKKESTLQMAKKRRSMKVTVPDARKVALVSQPLLICGMRTLLARARRSPVVKAARNALSRVTGRRSTSSAPAAEAVANDASDHGRPRRNAAEKTKDKIKTKVAELDKYDDEGDYYSSSDSHMSDPDAITKLHDEIDASKRTLSQNCYTDQ